MRHVLSAHDIRKLARIDTEYHSLSKTGATSQGFEARVPSFNGRPGYYLAGGMQPISLPIHRTEYVSPGIDWQRWYFHVPGDGGPVTQMVSLQAQRYEPGERRHESQLAGPLTVVGAGTLDARSIEMMIYDMTNTAGNTLNYDPKAPGWTSELKAWKNGQQFCDRHDFEGGFGLFAPTTPAVWQVERDSHYPGKLPLGTFARTVWRFTTKPVTTTGSIALPVLNVEYVPVLDPYNQAPAGRALPMWLDVHRADGAQSSPVTSVRVAFSADGGTAWTNLRAVPADDGRYLVVLPAKALAAGATVSLHVTAQDAGGSSVDQTLTDAFSVTG